MEGGGWYTRVGRYNYRVGLQKAIRKEAALLIAHSGFTISDGRCVFGKRNVVE